MNTLDFNTLKSLTQAELGATLDKAHNGDYLSWHYLGLHYLSPKSRNVTKAIDCFTIAGHHDISTSLTILADLYIGGELVEKDTDLAVDYYNQACQLNDIDAIRALAILHYSRFLNTGATVELSLSKGLADKAKSLGYEDIYNYIFLIMKSTT